MRQRRDPRRERDARRLPSANRPRFSQTKGTFVSAQAASVQIETPTQSPPRKIDTPAFLVLAIAGPDTDLDAPETRAVIAAARTICDGQDGAVCLLSTSAEDKFGQAGADRVILTEPGHISVTNLAALAGAFEVTHLIFPETPYSGDLARRVAARLGSRFLAGVEHIAGGQAHSPARGGQSELVAPLSQVISVSVPHFEALSVEPGEARLLQADLTAEPEKAPGLIWQHLPIQPDEVTLAEAEFILGGGDGITDWEAFSDLGVQIGAAIGGSRVVCDAGHLPRNRQIGASGTIVTARCYLAMGISGAPQHLQGVTDVPHIVAVNTDLHAQMVKRADLAIIADAQDVMPALIDLLAEAGPEK